MSACDIKFLPKKGSALNSDSHKRIRRKRHRNKCRNSSLKKKKLKKLHFSNRTRYLVTSFKSNNFKFSSFSEEIMSNWYWSNYKKAVEWQNRHKVAHWKACALSLYEENRYLLQIINCIHPSVVPEVPVSSQQNLECEVNKKVKTKLTGNFTKLSTSEDECKDLNFSIGNSDDGNDQEEVNDDIEFEMSEEMMEFFVQSYKKKMDLKKFEEKELLDNTEQEVKQIQNNRLKRSTEMNLLYGEGASMITGMETAVQLTFDKYCDTKSPKYWPNIPFRL